MLPWKETHPFQGAVSAKTAREALCPEKGTHPVRSPQSLDKAASSEWGSWAPQEQSLSFLTGRAPHPWLYRALGSNHSTLGTLGGRASMYLFTLKKGCVHTHTNWMCLMNCSRLWTLPSHVKLPISSMNSYNVLSCEMPCPFQRSREQLFGLSRFSDFLNYMRS